MALATLEVRGFRNLHDATLEFSAGTNYLFGPNASGKTNLLEAIHLLAVGRSFRSANDREMLGFGRESMLVSGRDAVGSSGEIRSDGRRRRVFLNARPVRRLSDYLGWMPLVILILDDVDLVRGRPALRRAFLDMAIAKADRSYVRVLGEYRRTLGQLNRLLEDGANDELLAVWEEQLVQCGVPVLERRAACAERLLKAAEGYFTELTGEELTCAYETTVADHGEFADSFTSGLASSRKRSLHLGRVVVGPHRDDIRVQQGGKELRVFGSAGEQRLAAIALRLAEADLLAESCSQRPLFLLDEVAAELDEDRSARVLRSVVARGQAVYAAASCFAADGKVFRVEAGKVAEVS